MASNSPSASNSYCNSIKSELYTCEICGLESLNEEQMRSHTRTFHIEGHGSCPFCDMAAPTLEELTLHVNQMHLDYLTPENECLTFIDEDNTPSRDNVIENNWRDDDDNKGAVGGVTNNVNVGRGYGGGEGSPYRSQLALKLKSNASQVLNSDDSNKTSESPPLQCPLCPHKGEDPARLEEHINRQHFDLTSPMLSSTTEETTLHSFPCPLCVRSFSAASDLELHVNIEHRDVLSPCCTSNQASPQTSTSCPVCGTFLETADVARHVEEHFPAASPDQRESQRVREQHEFDLLRAQYGMDNQGNFREQSVANMQRAVYAGEMSVADYYERQLELRTAESYGVDDGSSVTKHIVQKVRVVSPEALTCTYVDHYASSYGDRGWGCGYRNAQMLFSSLLTHTGYNDLLYRKLWAPDCEMPPRTAVPSISRLQVQGEFI